MWCTVYNSSFVATFLGGGTAMAIRYMMDLSSQVSTEAFLRSLADSGYIGFEIPISLLRWLNRLSDDRPTIGWTKREAIDLIARECLSDHDHASAVAFVADICQCDFVVEFNDDDVDCLKIDKCRKDIALTKMIVRGSGRIE